MEVEGLLRSLKEHKVRFVIIGATAFPVHGYSRATLDTDIFIEPTPRNAQRAREALQTFGYDMSDVSVDDLLTKKLLIRQYVVETDIHPFVKGSTFEWVWANKGKARLGRTFVWFASLDDLIEMKQAAGRPKDKEDLKFLRRLRQKRANRRQWRRSPVWNAALR
jgi:predicted nucleotidyltransferase